MAELCLAAGSDAAGTMMVNYLVKPIERGFCYLFCFHKIVQELHDQERILTIEQAQLDGKVDEAKGQMLIIETYVVDWLKNAENVLKDVESLEGRIEENKRCLRWCWSWRYRLSKEIEKKTLDLIKLVDQSKSIQIVGRRAPLPGIEFMPCEDFVVSKSSTIAFNEIMRALMDDKVNMIGVWGMGGLGKTTLVIEVGRKAKELQVFHTIIKVVVSQTPDIEKIQDKLADFLNLKFEKLTVEGKAEELWLRLKNEEKRILIILDDMWNELNLKDIGIPFNENGKGCTIILTTRENRVCNLMNCEVTVSLGVLDEEEAWTLFKMKGNLDNVAPEIIKVAMEVAKECKGLPMALIPLAKALRDKNLYAWESALDNLKDLGGLMQIENVEEKNAYTSLKISYDHLKMVTTKKCFLLCALFPEDYLIDVEELVGYAFGLMLYYNPEKPNEHSMKKVRREVLVAIDNLKDSSLVVEDEKAGYVMMHDVVRDVALWIASKENNGLVKKPGFASQNESSKVKLEILLLKNYGGEAGIPLASFKGLEDLKVLNLRMVSNKPFSFTILESLTNLRVLNVEECSRLNGISSLAKLTRLEILTLGYSKIEEELVDELGELENLRVLDLRGCSVFLRFSPNFIRRLVHLEELYLYPLEFIRSTDIDSILPKLSWSRLTSLSLKLSSLQFPEGFMFPKLERYRIDIINTKSKTSSSISLSCMRGLPLNVISKLLLNLESLEVRNGTKRTGQNVPAAKELRIYDCENLQVMFQKEMIVNEAPILSKLKNLNVQDLPDLEYIWDLPIKQISLQNLKAMKIIRCHKLKSVFSFSLAQSLVLLEELEITSCGQLEQIVEELTGDQISSNINPDTISLCLPKLVYFKISACKSLKYIFPKFMSPKGIPQLKRLKVEYLSQLRQVFNSAIVTQREEESRILIFPYLMEFSVSHCPRLIDTMIRLEAKEAHVEGILLSKLKEALITINTQTLFLKKIGDHNIIPEANQEGLNELTSLELDSCDSLEYLVDTTKEHVPYGALSNLVELSLTSMHGLKMLCNGQSPVHFLQNLKKLTVVRCPQLRELLSRRKEDEAQQLLSNLEHLKLQCVPELIWILKGPPRYVSFQSLKVVDILNCQKVKYFFSPSLIQSLDLLEQLRIGQCYNLKTLFLEMDSDGEIESNNAYVSQPQCLPNLRTLKIHGCRRLEYVLPIILTRGLSKLEELEIKECDKLRTLFLELNSDGEMKSSNYEYPESLPKLRTLKIHGCRRLEYVLPITLAQGLSQLEELNIEHCKEMRTLFLELECNDGTKSSSYADPMCLPKLRTLIVHKCGRLEYVLPITLAQGILQLQSARVIDCPQLEQVFGVVAKEQDGVAHGIELPCLKDLVLWRLTKLSHFCPKNYFLKAPSFDKLTIATSEPSDFYKEVENEVHLKLSQEIPKSILMELSCNIYRLTSFKLEHSVDFEFLVDTTSKHVPTIGIFTNLVELKMFRLINLRMLCYGPTPEGFLQNLERLLVNNCPNIVSLSLVIGENLKYLEVSRCYQLQEIFRVDEFAYKEENRGRPLSNLQHLELTLLPELRWILRGPTCHVNLQSLKDLEIRWCGLKSLFSPSLIPSLGLLQKLEIYDCENLECVFMDQLESDDDQINSNMLIMICLPNLEIVKISGCTRLEYVFPAALAQGLPRLRTLRLWHLKNLRGLIAENYCVKLPALNDISVKFCPQLTNFTIQQEVNKVIPLKVLSIIGEQCTDNNESCNTMIKAQLRQKSPNLEYITVGSFDEPLFQLQAGSFILVLETVKLQNLVWLEDIWRGQIHVVSNLRELRISNCNRLKYIFPLMLITNLPRLSILEIECCENLEGIIAIDLASSSQGHHHMEKKMAFPRLKEISLKKLPNLISFNPEGFHLVFPYLLYLTVKDCPKMSTIFTVDNSTLTVHAKREALGLAERETMLKGLQWRYDDDNDDANGEQPISILPPYMEEGEEI